MKYNPNEIINSAQKLSRRALLVGALQLGVVTALGARMRFLQVKGPKSSGFWPKKIV